MTYTVTLTQVQQKAMEHIAVDVQEWITNSVNVRANIAINEIAKKEIERMTNDPNITSIPADKNQIVLNANIQTAKNISISNSIIK